MRLSNTFNKTMNAYKDKYRFIINSGGSRSSKTYSTLQLLYIIAKNSTKKRIIHVVSYSTPHLRDGAITDFEDIIQNEGEDLEEVRLKNPYTFTIGNSIIKFIGIDRDAKALGGQKDKLFINNLDAEVNPALVTSMTLLSLYQTTRYKSNNKIGASWKPSD